ncbi:sensor domain-containing diguanylate cyclase [Microbacterium sp. DT81.1]|uniref:sensor domain-containing diguanylate cyclase n=1 Tax=Microbacterium sp. DT81.1 TaxID=3393413 RepID=UPI003CF0B32E
MNEDEWERRYNESPCGLLSSTAEGTILEANATLLEWMGYGLDELVGRPFTSLLEPGSKLFYATRHLPVLHLQGRVDQVALTMVTADGTPMPVLVNSVLIPEGASAVVRTAVFDATERLEYERELVNARRSAESSESRVRILQDVSSTFGLSANDEDVVESFAEIAREAFAATHASVLLYDEAGELHLAAGTNPLWGNVAPVETLRRSPVEIVVTVDDADTDYPDLAAGLRAARLDALSIMPLSTESEQLGILVCLFSRQRDFDAQFFELQRALGRQASQTLVRVRLQRQLSHMALHDQLTGLANRQLLLQSIDAAIADAERSGDALSLVFLDIDGFKAVNDRLGHAAGDAVLREVAERLRNAVRADDILGRMGGDEFVVICPTADARAAASIAERLRSFSRHQIEAGPEPLWVSASIGVATYSPEVDGRPSPQELLIRADAAMYESKGSGKDNVSHEQLQPPTLEHS